MFLQSGGPSWAVPKGRKDGRISKASETKQLPAPLFNISQLQQSFSQRGLSINDLVALSGKFQTISTCKIFGFVTWSLYYNQETQLLSY